MKYQQSFVYKYVLHVHQTIPFVFQRSKSNHRNCPSKYTIDMQHSIRSKETDTSSSYTMNNYWLLFYFITKND